MMLPQPVELLRVHRSTVGLDEDQIRKIAEEAEIVRAAANQVLYQPGQQVALLLVISGHLALDLVLPGGETKPVMYFGRDDQVGLLGIVQDEPMPVNVVAQQPSLLLRITAEAATRLVQEVPLWGRNMLRTLGPRVRDSLIGEKGKRRQRLVTLIHTSDQSRQVTAELTERLISLGETVGLVSDCDRTLSAQPAHRISVLGSDGQLLPLAELRQRLGSWTDADRVILDTKINTIGTRLAPLLLASEAAYWFCGPESCRDVVKQLEPIVREAPVVRDKVSLVQILEPKQQVAPLTTGIDRVCRSDLKLHWNGCEMVDSPVCTRAAGLNRILHHLRGVSIGLALGGGAARGMAHLGVLKVLEDSGISIDRMSGTSAGALTGIPYAAGYSAEFLTDSFARDLKPDWRYRMLPYGDAIYALVKFRFAGWDRMLRKYLRDWRLEQLPVPFSSVAADLVSGDSVIRCAGDATAALLESINLPGIARPICADGMTLVDGGVLNVVPANVVASQGANVVISSDVSAKIRFEFAGNQPDTPTEKMKVPSTAATLTRMRTVQDRNIRSVGGHAADIVIEPDVSTVEITDFKNAARIAQLGSTAAQESLPQIRGFLHEMDPELFPL
jgi:predicted acylesterase/phospholipase RssA/CRP-like cAMP-binding protein